MSKNALDIAKKNSAAAKQKREDEEKQMQLFLPQWDDERRAMPNDFARAALFTVRRRSTKRLDLKDTAIFVLGDCEITYRGEELRAADDELVWLQILNMAKAQPLGEWIEFTPYEICKAIAWPNTSYYYNIVHVCILRMIATAVAVKNKKEGVGKALSFIQEYEWQDASGKRLPKARVKIHKGMQKLFAGNKFTEVEWRAYRKFTPLARRLYDYAASHRDPYAIKLDTLKDMTGSQSERANRWKDQVKDACQELNETGLIVCEINGDLINFDRKQPKPLA